MGPGLSGSRVVGASGDERVLDVGAVDAAFSVATLHWIPNHEAVFGSLASVLRPGGLLRAEWGGRGNLAGINDVLAAIGRASVDDTLQFADAEQTAARLTAAGFINVQVNLVPDPVQLQPGEQLEAFLATVVLGTVLDPKAHQEDCPADVGNLGEQLGGVGR